MLFSGEIMFQKGIGIAFGRDTATVAAKAASRALEQNPEPELAIMFASVKYDQEILFDTVRNELNHIPVFGTTSPLVITNLGVSRDCVAIMLVSGESLSFSIQAGKCSNDPERVASYLCSQLLFENPDLEQKNTILSCILTGTEKHGRGNLYLQGMNSAMPRPLPVSGGASVGIFPTDDQDLLHSGYQYCGDMLNQDHLNLLFLNLSADEHSVGYSYESSWKPVANSVRCTRVNYNIVQEVDGIPIFEYLEKALGKGFHKHLVYTRPRFSFVARAEHGNDEKCLVRAVTNWDFENGAITFWPYVDMQNEEIQLVQLSREDLLHGTGEAAQKAFDALNGMIPEIVLVFSCTIRSMLLHTMADEEVEKVRQVFGDSVPILGFYCNAEYSPLYQNYSDIINSSLPMSGSQQFGCSVAILAIGSRTCSSGNPRNCIDRNYTEILGEQWNRDNLDLALTDSERVTNLETLLNQAESIISENEKALKYIITEHYHTNLELKKTNEDLQTAHGNNERLKEVIRQYTPHNVWKKASISVMAGLYNIPDEEMRCSLMFMDVKGFTSFAESHSPEEVIGELNKIFSPATELIYRHEGDIDKFIGDCIFAMFKKPSKALECAVEIQKLVKDNRNEGSPFSLRIGINFGRIISGNVGSDQRKENALIGDAVNLAQRLESACPEGSILVSDDFFNKLPSSVRGRFKWNSYSVRVKGKEKELKVHEVAASAMDPIN
ncbi:MAG: hypothetical protein CVV64_15960 [Candidatus Wallbacteria bacterium HGW-Wallbacteria-1]|jgi:class 3 adenylate cyclase|uniref:Guanylate cyclase domain-containing protein n=1 Tax=Candidatus Wallbacteria bacterium HGW-Wallbacteria-1 TaxID=2013854 RepID=A0A2N1PLB8_9BACT|nr:MAG: hypothetical protein CVV64_15960 [Candidatus Wallbacteria bacterium HGW-Wallbacteria-1]